MLSAWKNVSHLHSSQVHSLYAGNHCQSPQSLSQHSSLDFKWAARIPLQSEGKKNYPVAKISKMAYINHCPNVNKNYTNRLSSYTESCSLPMQWVLQKNDQREPKHEARFAGSSKSRRDKLWYERKSVFCSCSGESFLIPFLNWALFPVFTDHVLLEGIIHLDDWTTVLGLRNYYCQMSTLESCIEWEWRSWHVM